VGCMPSKTNVLTACDKGMYSDVDASVSDSGGQHAALASIEQVVSWVCAHVDVDTDTHPRIEVSVWPWTTEQCTGAKLTHRAGRAAPLTLAADGARWSGTRLQPFWCAGTAPT
jgi:hypothetical protein